MIDLVIQRESETCMSVGLSNKNGKDAIDKELVVLRQTDYLLDVALILLQNPNYLLRLRANATVHITFLSMTFNESDYLIPT